MFLFFYFFSMFSFLFLLIVMLYCIFLLDILVICKWRLKDLIRNLIIKDNKNKLDGIIVCLVFIRYMFFRVLLSY